MLKNIKVSNMVSSSGNKVPNQFIIRAKTQSENQIAFDTVYFQSYDSIIAEVNYTPLGKTVFLDEEFWNYSVTTGKYRNIFLGETKKETQAKIDNGTYRLVNLN